MHFSPGSPPTFKSYSVNSLAGTSGTYHFAGFYTVNAGEAVLNQGALTQAEGAANVPYGAHAFFVAKAAGGASGGSTGTAKVTVTGTSITDAGVRNASGSEIIVADVTAAATNEYFETSLKWIGTVTYTIAATGDHTTFDLSGNYGLCKYEDFGNRAFKLTDWEFTGIAGATHGTFDLEVLHHKATGWTYSAAAFTPGAAAILKFTTDYDVENDLDSGLPVVWKRAELSTSVAGAASEGLIIRMTTGANNLVENGTAHFGVLI